MHLEMESLRAGYGELGRAVMEYGQQTSPRGEKTVEVLGASFTCQNPADSLPVGTGRGVVKALAATETLQLIGGFHDPETLVRAAPHFQNYLDPATGRQRSPYGPRLVDQIPEAIEQLKQDPDSRRAQVTIWHPDLDSEQGLHDYPCTTSLQWFIRNDDLHMQVHMRSNDFWLGVPYDVFMFTQLQLTIADVLGIGVGAYRHSAASLHIYEKHWLSIDDLEESTADPLPTYGMTGTDWWDARSKAARIHDDTAEVEELTPGERWLHLAMAKLHG